MLCSIFLLTACGPSEPTTGEAKELDEDKVTLRVVTDAAYTPFEYLEGDGIKGFDIDFVRAVAEEAGYNVKIEHVSWDPLFEEIENKDADLAVSAITINEDRKQTYDFSVAYFLSTNKILVLKDSDIKSGEDLEGKVVAVQNGTTAKETVEAILGKNNQDIRKFENNNLAIQALLNGKADAVVADNTVLEEYVKKNPEKDLMVITDKSFAEEHYGFMFPKGSGLKEKMDKAIDDLFDNGSFTEIYQQWFGTKPDIEYLKELQNE
nr:basic amino acid ABC transporter substrate-binding protein [Bacillus benzoevorans]